MLVFARRRALQALITLLGATFLLFSAVTVLPGDPIRALFGPVRPDPEVLETVRDYYRFDEPFLVQYGAFIANLVTGDLGRSYPDNLAGQPQVGPPISQVLRSSLPVSAVLLGTVILIEIGVGIAVGVTAVVGRRRRRRAVDLVLYAFAVVLVSVPVIVSAFVLQGLVAVPLTEWLPVRGTARGWISYLLPVLALAASATAYVALITRAELLETLRAPFVRALRARNLSEKRIVGLHALKASLLPVVTFVAAHVGELVAGLIVVEGVFELPGIGGQLFEAIQRQDRALLVVLVTLVVVVVIVANALADVLYAVVDPRITLDGDGEAAA